LKKESHKLLGQRLMEGLGSLPAPRCKRAFLFGCIQPDYNIFTYLKGSWRAQWLKGHNYKNSERCMNRTIYKLQSSSSWGMKEYYRLGKLIHYVSDAFTYPHNDYFGENLKEHRCYEGTLNSHFKEYIDKPLSIQIGDIGDTIVDSISLIHRQYSDTFNSILTDAAYIITAADIVFNTLIQKSSAVMGLPIKYAV